MELKDLKEFLNKTGQDIPSLAATLDCNKQYLGRVMKGSVLPGRRLARDIYAATFGAIELQTRPRKGDVNQQQQVA